MSNVTGLKPWFQEDIARVLMSIYFTSMMTNSHSSQTAEFRSGFAAALSSVAINIGVKPESFLAPDDINLLRQSSRGG
jgi:hypothetical protein